MIVLQLIFIPVRVLQVLYFKYTSYLEKDDFYWPALRIWIFRNLTRADLVTSL